MKVYHFIIFHFTDSTVTEYEAAHEVELKCTSKNSWTILNNGTLRLEESTKYIKTQNLFFSGVNFTELPCASLTECVDPPENPDTELQMVDKKTVIYRCKDRKVFNFPSLNFPSEVKARCEKNKLFNGLLPFWKIDGIPSLINDDDLCISTEECRGQPPEMSSQLTNT